MYTHGAIVYRLNNHQGVRDAKVRARPIQKQQSKRRKAKSIRQLQQSLTLRINPGPHFTGHSATIVVGYDALLLSYMSLERWAEYSSFDLIPDIGAN